MQSTGQGHACQEPLPLSAAARLGSLSTPEISNSVAVSARYAESPLSHACQHTAALGLDP